MTVSDLTHTFAALENCCLHDPQWRPSQVAAIVCYRTFQRTDDDRFFSVIVIVTLRNAQYGLLLESQDYTGHGCECGAMTVTEPTLAKLLSHLQDGELTALLTPQATAS